MRHHHCDYCLREDCYGQCLHPDPDPQEDQINDALRTLGISTEPTDLNADELLTPTSLERQ